METKIEINNLCPIIGVISAGKTSILKVFFDNDFLEANSGVGTKFIKIIRYNPEVGKNPRFYHLKLKNLGNGDYEYYKDQKFKEVIGKENIKEKNKQLNEEFKKKRKTSYEQLFYMIEVGEVNFIKDKEYLKNYDFVDIPGLNEYNPNENNFEDLSPPPFDISFEEDDKNKIEHEKSKIKNKQKKSVIFDTMEDEMLTYDPNSEKNYYTEIFKIIRKKMNNGIIVLSIDNYQYAGNYRIIAKLQKVINKPIENFLILLNKIDKSENKEYDLNTLKCKILKYFPSVKVFNPTKNLIVACSSIQLENELKMENSFKHLLYYYFLNFLMNSRVTSDGTTNKVDFSFIDFLKKVNPNKNIKKKSFVDKIFKIIDDNNRAKILDEIIKIITFLKEENQIYNLNLGIREDEFQEKQILKIKDNLQIEEGKEEQEDEEEEEFNLDDIDGNAIILYYYSKFKKKKIIPPLSIETKTIMNYFTMANMTHHEEEENEIEIKDNKKKIEEKKTLSNKINDISTRMMEFYKEYEKEKIKEHNLDTLRKYINLSIGILKTSKFLYIPLLGEINVGKSTILNGIIGRRILPTQKNECTKKGILIKHWDKDYPVIRKTRLKMEEIGTDKIYFFEPDEDIIAKGIKKIHRVLEGTNSEYSQKEEDFFYEIDINIKLVNDLKLDDSLKEKICFIDLPGFGTNNEFEKKGVYARLMKACNIFLFVVFNLTIKKSYNKKMLNNLFTQMSKYRGIPVQEFIKKCLLIINFDIAQDTSEKSKIQVKNDIISVVDDLNNTIINDFNFCFFNAKYYENYIYKLEYYNSPHKLVNDEYEEYLSLLFQKWKGKIEKIKGGTFNKFLKEKLKDNIKNDIIDNFDEKTAIVNKEVEKEVLNIIDEYKFKFNKNEITTICKLITYGKDNFLKSNLLINSNIDVFEKELLILISNAKIKEDKEINTNLIQCFKILDNVFQVYPNTKIGPFLDAPIDTIVKSHVQEDLDTIGKEVDRVLQAINLEFFQNDIVKILSICSVNLINDLNEQKNNLEKNLKNKKWDKIQKEFEEIFEKDTNILKSELLETLEKASKNIAEYLSECYDNLDNFYSDKIKRKDLLYKNYISNCMGGDNDIEKTLDQMLSDIINGSRHSTDKKNVEGIFNYLNKTFDYIIQQSTIRIKSFCDKIKEEDEKFKKDMIDEITSSKERVVYELKQKKEKEELEKKKAEVKNEKERKLWEEEKRLQEKKKVKWESLCKKYRALRDEITLIRLTS